MSEGFQVILTNVVRWLVLSREYPSVVVALLEAPQAGSPCLVIPCLEEFSPLAGCQCCLLPLCLDCLCRAPRCRGSRVTPSWLSGGPRLGPEELPSSGGHCWQRQKIRTLIRGFQLFLKVMLVHCFPQFKGLTPEYLTVGFFSWVLSLGDFFFFPQAKIDNDTLELSLI